MKKTIDSKLARQTAIISILLGVASVTTVLACLIFKHANNRAYRQKWKDYDDCGLA